MLIDDSEEVAAIERHHVHSLWCPDCESLVKDRPIEGFALSVRKIVRADVGDVTAGQPLIWTFIEFDVDDSAVDQLAASMSRALDPTIGWYCDYRTSDETFVVFAGQVGPSTDDGRTGTDEPRQPRAPGLRGSSHRSHPAQ